MRAFLGSGLDGIVLLNGYAEVPTPFGPGLNITHPDDLLCAIARRLLFKRNDLTGAELAFLRMELGYTQCELSEVIGVSSSALGKWEARRETKVPAAVDRLVRLIYLEYVSPGESTDDFLNMRARRARDAGEDGPGQFRHVGTHWVAVDEEGGG